jgi:hypothetical protein
LTVWQEMSARVHEQLRAMNDGQQAMFACAVAERLMRRHEALPEKDQQAFTLGLRPLLDAAWNMACGDQTAFTEIKRALGEYYLSEYCHNDGQDGPDDADESAAAAAIYAAEFAMHGCLEFATWAGLRGEEAADQAGWDSDEELDEDADENELIHIELSRQLEDLDLIGRHADDLRYARNGRDIATISRLHSEVKAALSDRP